jgi:hypothetical protein
MIPPPVSFDQLDDVASGSRPLDPGEGNVVERAQDSGLYYCEIVLREDDRVDLLWLKTSGCLLMGVFCRKDLILLALREGV